MANTVTSVRDAFGRSEWGLEKGLSHSKDFFHKDFSTKTFSQQRLFHNKDYFITTISIQQRLFYDKGFYLLLLFGIPSPFYRSRRRVIKVSGRLRSCLPQVVLLTVVFNNRCLMSMINTNNSNRCRCVSSSVSLHISWSAPSSHGESRRSQEQATLLPVLDILVQHALTHAYSPV
jgi:hypothetical protein